MRLVTLLLATTMASALRKVLVTGANKGIGKRIATRILTDIDDSFVYLGARDAGRGAAAVADLLAEYPQAEGRLELLELDTESDASVKAAAEKVDSLWGLCNNAGVGFGRSIKDTLAPNYYGSKRVCEAFLPKIESRICNVGSASAPNFVSGLGDASLKAFFTSSSTTLADLEKKLDAYAAAPDYEGVAYGLSKASLHVLTMQLQKKHPSLFINTCSPGYVLTDLTAGMGASKTPEQSNCHVAPLHILFGDDVAQGWYYGSDAVRSPLDVYRGPGDAPYESDTW
jgi:NAD(P)-dependent dehydrogenase (short-subunit alcohol dehydrogenase family)